MWELIVAQAQSADSILSWAETVKDLTLSAALVILLYGGRQRWWCFGYQLSDAERREAEAKQECTARVAEAKAECDARLEAAQRREDEWKELALAGGRVASEAVGLAKQRANRG